MPFNFEEYSTELEPMNIPQLEKEKQRYTRAISSSLVGYSVGLFAPPVALIGVAASAASGLNAGVKLGLINSELESRSEESRTRKRDILAGASLAGISAGLGQVVSLGAVDVISDGLGKEVLSTTEEVMSHVIGGAGRKDRSISGPRR
jgi:hypothetical protein